MITMTIRELLEALPRTQQDAWRENFQGRVEEVIVIVIVIFVIIVLIVIIVIVVIVIIFIIIVQRLRAEELFVDVTLATADRQVG